MANQIQQVNVGGTLYDIYDASALHSISDAHGPQGPQSAEGLYTIQTDGYGHTKTVHNVIGSHTGTKEYGVQLDTNKHAYVKVPWTDEHVSSVDNHYVPSANSGSQLNANASGAAAAWSIDVVKGVQVQRDAAGHVTGLSVVSGKIPANPNTDTKVTSAANHYSPSADSGSQLNANASGATAAWSIDVVKGVQIQRDSKGHVTNLSVVSGKIPANPNTDTKVTSAENHYDPTTGSQSWLAGTEKTGTAVTWTNPVVTGVHVNKDTKGHITGVQVVTGTLPNNPNTDTKVTSVGNHYEPVTDTTAKLTANASGGTAAWNTDVVKGVTLQRDAAGHVTGLSVTSGKVPTNPHTSVTPHPEGLYKVTINSTGHVTGATAVTSGDIVNLITEAGANITGLQTTVEKLMAELDDPTSSGGLVESFLDTANTMLSKKSNAVTGIQGQLYGLQVNNNVLSLVFDGTKVNTKQFVTG